MTASGSARGSRSGRRHGCRGRRHRQARRSRGIGGCAGCVRRGRGRAGRRRGLRCGGQRQRQHQRHQQRQREIAIQHLFKSSRVKPLSHVRGIGLTHLHRGDLGARGPDPQPFHERAHRVLVTAGQNFHPAVRKVAGVAVDAELAGAARRGSAIENPLYPAADQTLPAHHARIRARTGKGRILLEKARARGRARRETRALLWHLNGP